MTCLLKCVQVYFLQRPTILISQTGVPDRFQCYFCRRQYSRHKETLKCASECSETEIEKINQESRLSKVLTRPIINTLLERRKTPKLISIKPIMPFQKTKNSNGQKKQRREVFSKKDTIFSDVQIIDRKPVETPLNYLKDEFLANRKRKGDKKFIREGAKYVCIICNKRYYTRLEVVACFDKHEDA